MDVQYKYSGYVEEDTWEELEPAEINDILIEVDPDITVYEACLEINIQLPRFCYHDLLTIVGNCRMCLVEDDRSEKLVVSCATPMGEGAIIYTKTDLVLEAREAVLEYLLVNHPLDCPVCDQGGECDLQDQLIGYGSDYTRFYTTKKRAVEDKNYSTLIKFSLNRCIHCTRCIRFSQEVSGSQMFSMIGRGQLSEIGYYINIIHADEFSGNVIDLCPVGALTSKVYSFTGRSWEFVEVISNDCFDTFFSPIKIDTLGLDIIRVSPLSDYRINDEWISDKVRFNYMGYNNQRTTLPLLLLFGRFFYIDWIPALKFYKRNFIHTIKYSVLNNFINFMNPVICGSFLDIITVDLLKNFFKNHTVANFLKLYYSRDASDFRSSYLSTNVDIKSYNIIILNNTNLRFECPTLNFKIKSNIYDIEEGDDNYILINFGYSYNSNVKINFFDNNISYLMQFIKGICVSNSKLLLINNSNLSISYSLFDSLKNWLVSIHGNAVDCIEVSSESSLTSILDINLPTFNRACILNSFFSGITSLKNFNISSAYNVSYDNFNNLLYKNDFSVSVYQGSHFDYGIKIANFVLPARSFIENSNLFINSNGIVSKNMSAPTDRTLLSYRFNSDIFKFLNFNMFNISQKRVINNSRLFDILFRDKKYFNKQISILKLGDMLHNVFSYYSYGNFILKSKINDFFLSDFISRSAYPIYLASGRFNIINDFKYVIYSYHLVRDE